MAKDNESTDLKLHRLRILSAMLEKDADFPGILSGDCRELGVDPRTPMTIRTCKANLDACLWDKQCDGVAPASPSLRLESEITCCSSSCKSTKRDIRLSLYDVAASLGDVTALCSLPNLYDDVQSCTSTLHQQQMNSEPSDGHLYQTPKRKTENSQHCGNGKSCPDETQLNSQDSSGGTVHMTQNAGACDEDMSHSELYSLSDTDSWEHGEHRLRRGLPESVESMEVTLRTTLPVPEDLACFESGSAARKSDAVSVTDNANGKPRRALLFRVDANKPSSRGNVQARGVISAELTQRDQEETETFFDSVESQLDTKNGEQQQRGALFSIDDDAEVYFDAVEEQVKEREKTLSGTASASRPILNDLAIKYSSMIPETDLQATNCAELVCCHAGCQHYSRDSCQERRSIVQSAITVYVKAGFPVERLADVVKSQPCSEDAVMVFDVLNGLPDVRRDALDMTSLLAGFGASQGAHSGRTPLMSACCHGNERLLQLLLKQKAVDTEICDQNDLTAVQHLLGQDCEEAQGQFETRKRMAKLLLLHSAKDHIDSVLEGTDLALVTEKNDLDTASQRDEGDFVFDENDLDPIYGHDLDPICGNGDFDLVSERKHHSHSTKTNGFNRRILFPGATEEDEDDSTIHDSTIREKQSRLCRLVFQSLEESAAELRHLDYLFDREIEISVCNMSCTKLLFPDLGVEGMEPPVLFSTNEEENEALFLAIEKGRCPCPIGFDLVRRHYFRFLPACACAAAENWHVFRLMMQRFLRRVQIESSESLTSRDASCRPVLKKTCDVEKVDQKKRTPGRRLRFNVTNYKDSDRQLTQILRHVLLAGPPSHLFRLLDHRALQAAVTLTSDSKVSLVDLALRLDDEDTFEWLVNRFGLDVQSEVDGLTPLLLAVSWGRVGMARALLQTGAGRGRADRYGRDALDIALSIDDKQGSEEMSLMLLDEGEGVDADPADPHTPSHLARALSLKRFAVVDRLLDSGLTHVPTRIKSAVRWCPAVAWCCSESRWMAARHLVERGLDFRCPVPWAPGRSPFRACLSSTAAEAAVFLELLVDKGADVNGFVGEVGHLPLSPLTVAAEYGNLRAVAVLISAGAVLDSTEPHPDPDPGAAGSCGSSGGDSTSLSSSSSSSSDRDGGGGSANAAGGGRSSGRLRAASDFKACSLVWHALRQKRYGLAEMAVVGGYRLQREHWFQAGQHPPATPQHVLDKLRTLLLRPLPLASACRKRLRDTLGSSLPAFLAAEGLPQAVVDFVLMKDLLEFYLDSTKKE